MSNKHFIILLVCLLANVALADDLPVGIKQADLPVYSPNAQLSLWVATNRGMEGASTSAYLYSDGTYCGLIDAMGILVVPKGKWQFNQNKTGIDIKIDSGNYNQFFLEVNDVNRDGYKQDKATTRPNTLELPDLFFDGQPVYLGFGNQEAPTEMVLFDNDKHQKAILVPKNSRYLFVGSKLDNKMGNQVARFNLNALGHNPYLINLMSNRAIGVSEERFNAYVSQNAFNYVIQDGKLGTKDNYSDNIRFFSKTFSIDLNTYQDDNGMDLKRWYGYCSGKRDEFYFDILQNTQSNLVKPTYLNWHGKISPTANWLKLKN